MAVNLSGADLSEFGLWDYCDESILHGDSQTLTDESKDLQRAMADDLPLNDDWLSRINFQVDQKPIEYYSDTESQAGGTSTAPSPAPTITTPTFQYMDDEELTSLSVKELNKKLKSRPKDIVETLKRRRRTLKNRGYAHSCRIKRLAEKSNLETSKESLEKDNNKLRLMLQQMNEKLNIVTRERDYYRNQYLSK